MDVNFAAGRSAPHQPSPYPFQNVSQSKPYDRMFKIVLHSEDASYDNHTSFTFRNVSIPFDTIRGNCRLFVSSFFTIADAFPSFPYYINIEELSQLLSFDSQTGTSTKTILTTIGNQHESSSPLYGVSLQDLSLFVQRTLTVTFKSANNGDDVDLVAYKGPTGDAEHAPMYPWTMTLGIIQTE
jgi:hypothetical protein